MNGYNIALLRLILCLNMLPESERVCPGICNEFIYVLFDSNIKDTSSKSKNEIWRYDWDGNLLNKYVPNVDISLITVHPDGTLIGLTGEEESKIAFVKF